MIDHAALKSRIEGAFEFAQKQVKALVENHPGFYPIYTQNGKWKHGGELWTDWCAGFLAGQLWMIAERTGDAWWREKAEQYTRALEPKKDDRDVHDLGFIFMSTVLRWLDLADDEAEKKALKDILIHAGRTLALRFKEKGEYLCSFIGPQSAFIDVMMNVRIIFYAALETGDEDLLGIANRHCRTTIRTLVRGDGSTAHEGEYDTDTGEFLRQTTPQGYRGDSCWSRGLTWSLYGFATSHAFVQDPSYLRAAQMCADYYCERTPENGVPPWDFDAPVDGSVTSGDRVDSSAGAIAASGLMQLAERTQDRVKAERYRTVAFRAVETLTSEEYLGSGAPGWEGVLRHGIYHLHKDLGVDESVMWGEYFCMEAMLKVLDAVGG